MKIGVMCSGNGTNFENIVRTCRFDEVVLMIYNKEGCGAYKRAEKFGIPSCYIKSTDEAKIVREFVWAGAELIVMQNLLLTNSFLNWVLWIIREPSSFLF